jgi:penicillin amidase
MLADDMHPPHTVPAIWFINHLKSPEMDVVGFSLPGVPWVIVGHNQRIAWGFTNLNATCRTCSWSASTPRTRPAT